MKKFLIIALLVIGIALAAFASGGYLKRGMDSVNPSESPITEYECPTEKIVDKMPGPGGAKSPYYIVNGERREVAEFNQAELLEKCGEIPVQEVY